jgi:hypothetical protein
LFGRSLLPSLKPNRGRLFAHTPQFLIDLTGISARSAQASNKIPKAKETIKKMKQITKHSGTLYNLKFQLTLV